MKIVVRQPLFRICVCLNDNDNNNNVYNNTCVANICILCRDVVMIYIFFLEIQDKENVV